MREDRGRMTVFSQAQEYNIKDGKSTIKWKLRAHKPAVILCFTLRELLSCDAMYLILWNGYMPKECCLGHTIVAIGICRWYAALIDPVEMDT